MPLTLKTEREALTSQATSNPAEETNWARTNDERLFFRIVSYSTALSFGWLLASFEAIYKTDSGFSFHVSLGTLAAFAIGFAAGLVYWKIVLLGSKDGGHLLLRTASSLIMLGGLAAFLYPLRFLSAEKLPDILTGLALAATALSLIGFMLWKLKTFLDQDSAAVET